MGKKSTRLDSRENIIVQENLKTSDQEIPLAYFEGIIQNIPGAVLLTDKSGIPLSYNQRATDILGEIPHRLLPEEWPEQFGLYRDEAKTRYPGNDFILSRALRGELVTEELFKANGSDAESKWISLTARPLSWEDNEVKGALILINDITSQKLEEISRQQQIQRAKASFNLSQEIAQIGNDPVKILNTVVEFATEVIGDGCVASLLNMPGDRLRIIAYHHKKTSAQRLLEKTLLTQEYGLKGMIEEVIRTGDPMLIASVNQERLRQVALPEQLTYLDEIGVGSLLVVPITGRNGVLGTLGLFRDRGGDAYNNEDQVYMMDVAYRIGMAIENNVLVHSLRMETSGRRIAEKALELSEVRFRSIFTSTTLGMKLLDLEGNILETNPAFQQMLLYEDEELKGSHISTYLFPVDTKRLLESLADLTSGQIQDFQFEHRLVRKDNSILWVNASFTGIKNNEREKSIVFVVGIVENITRRKRIEAEMAEMKSRLHSHIEMERLQLAQELHDGPLQELYSAIYEIENLNQRTEGENPEKIEGLSQDLLKVVKSLRNTAKDLRPPALADFGLEKAIRSYAEEFMENHPEISIHLSLAQDKQRLSEDIRLILFRIYQHSLTNILRHAQATQINVRFTFDAEEAQLEIKDNGVGFVVPDNWVELVRQGHFGLAGAVERVSLIDGTFTVESNLGFGTTVCVTVPIKGKSEESVNYPTGEN